MEIPKSRLEFYHKVYKQDNELINETNSTAGLVDFITRKVIHPV